MSLRSNVFSADWFYVFLGFFLLNGSAMKSLKQKLNPDFLS